MKETLLPQRGTAVGLLLDKPPSTCGCQAALYRENAESQAHTHSLLREEEEAAEEEEKKQEERGNRLSVSPTISCLEKFPSMKYKKDYIMYNLTFKFSILYKVIDLFIFIHSIGV